MTGFVARVDRHGFIRHWDGPTSGFGWMAVDLVGRQIAVLGPGLETVREALRDGVPKRTTAAIVRADGSPVNAEVVVAPAGRWGRRGAWIVGTIRSADETGLVSREAFSAAVAGALAGRRAPAVVMIEASGVEAVNQIVGHAAGDELLRQVGERLVRALPSGALATRYASRFIVLLPDGSAADLAAVGRALAAAVDGPVATGPAVVGVDVNVGASCARPGDDSAALLRHAEVALMAAHVTAAGAEVYDPGVHHGLEVRLERELGLRSAVDRGEFEVHYQPVVDLRDQQLVGAEALIRWRRGSGEMVMPTDFIDLAESSGAIIRIGLWTLHEACGQMRAWNDAYRPGRPLEVAVNLSVRQLGSAALISDIAGVILGVGIDPRRVTLEVTESSFMDNAEGMIRRLGELRTMGLTLSMDDFGTGYSSLSYLRDLPVDVVKIDRSFVGGVARSDEEWALVTAIVRLAKSLGKRTLAEGVETAAQLAHLRALGCDLAQGYLFGRPLPAEEFESLLAGGGPVVS